MTSEITRFVLLRQPKKTLTKDSKILKINLDILGEGSPLIKELETAKLSGLTEKMQSLADHYIQSEDFVDSLEKIDHRITDFAEAISEHSDEPIKNYIKRIYEENFSEPSNLMVSSPVFKKTSELITNSLISSIITSKVPVSVNTSIVSILYALYLIIQLSKDSLPSKKITDAKIILPSKIFPLPQIGHSLIQERQNQIEQRKKIAKRTKEMLSSHSRKLNDYQTTIKDIVSKFETSEIEGRTRRDGFVLSTDAASGLNDISKKVLKSNGFDNRKIDVAKTVTFLEKASADIANQLYHNMPQGTQMRKLGSILVPEYGLSDGGIEQHPDRIIPGICPLADVEFSGTDGKVTVPRVNGGKRKPLVAELIIVEQRLSRYEMGEIAHIENVLLKEKRERSYRNLKTIEETRLIETESTEENVKDLATTDRYELQSEAQNIINENASFQAGATISYDGPTVDATADASYATSTSSQESNRLSSNYAREITMRAANRVETRKLQRTLRRTAEETEEIIAHEFDNKDGTEHVSGIYRWVDKIYEAQMVNYGKKKILEFIIPEPAAFLRFASSQSLNSEELHIVRPDPPGSCMSDGKTFQPLRVEDIKPETYLFWVAAYNVENVTPPPSSIMIVSASLVNSGGEGEMRNVHFRDAETAASETITYPTWNGTTTVPAPADALLTTWAGASSKDVPIPDGYIPNQAYVNLKGQQGFKKATLTVQIQDKEVSNKDIGGGDFVPLTNVKTASVPFTVESFGFALYEVIVNIFCIRSIEKLQEWQLETFRAIMNSYNDQRSRYYAAVEAAKIRSGFNPIQGKNPIINRETEKLELKKGAISILTGQRFEDFNAVTLNAAPHGFPEIDFEEAKAEGDYIKFFEQAIDWNNMTYLFYPYFWSNKKEWLMLSRIDDADPLYTRFLQAGSARVQVPIREGFESAILSFLSGAKIWNGKGEFVIDDKIDPDLLSIAEEFKSQSGNNSIIGKGTLMVIKGSRQVQGNETDFSNDDKNRRIIIKGKTYVINEIQNSNSITLQTEYVEDDDSSTEYALGGILVGQPWEIKIPTNLVKIDSSYKIG